MADLKDMLDAGETVLAPLALNGLMAKLAEQAGFRALYLGGGASGYQAVWLEANLTLTEMAAAGTAVRSACDLPLILDGAGGWGDPMHIHRSVRHAEAAGFAAIEIEDQVLPKRAHHHVGVEHVIPQDLMVAKIREAVRARRDPGFAIIGRTNAARCISVDEALRRAEAYHEAGADMLFVLPGKPEDVRTLGERLPAPLMYMTLGGGLEKLEMSPTEMAALGYRFIVDPMSPVLAYHQAMRETYRAMRAGVVNPLLGSGYDREHEALNRSIDLETLLAIERATVEKE